MAVSTASISSSLEAPRPLAVPAQKYRREFDGLRAIASLVVVAAHAGFIPHAGGVDVFFVLSGFLISGNILRSLARGSFHFVDFYIRRVRRIFPPLIIMVSSVLTLGWFVLLPDEFERLGKYVVAGAVFAVNIAWNFDAIPAYYFTGSPPITHIWSLGVEEQFYLFWPILLVATWRFGRQLTVLVAAIATLAFFLFVMQWPLDRHQDLFLPWMFYLACGSALACMQVQGVPGFKSLRAVLPTRLFPRFNWPISRSINWPSAHIQGLVAALLLTAWFTGLNSRAHNWGVLAPAIGTLLLITSGPQSWVNRYVLGSSPLVSIGRISYQLYLWHYPLLYVQHTVDADWPVSPTVMTMAEIAMAFALAYLTYRYVEVPLRSSKNIRSVAYTLSVAMIALGFAGYLVCTGRIPARPQSPGVVGFLKAANEDWLPGTNNLVWTPGSDNFLVLGQGAQRVLFLGDSNMQQYYPRIAKLLADHPQNTHSAIFAAMDGCAPGGVELVKLDETLLSVCRNHLRKAAALAQDDPSIDTVVIAACWSKYFVAARGLGLPGPLKPGTDQALERLRRMIDDFVRSGKRVYVVLSSPTGIDFDPRWMIRRTVVAPGFKLVVRSPERAQVTNAVDPIDSKVRALALQAGATLVEPMKWLCHAESCPVVSRQGEPIYHDMLNLRPSYVRENVRFLDATVLDEQLRGGS